MRPLRRTPPARSVRSAWRSAPMISLGAAPDDGTGTVNAACHPSDQSPVVSLSPGLYGSYSMRRMASGSNRLNYNLHTDVNRNDRLGRRQRRLAERHADQRRGECGHAPLQPHDLWAHPGGPAGELRQLCRYARRDDHLLNKAVGSWAPAFAGERDRAIPSRGGPRATPPLPSPHSFPWDRAASAIRSLRRRESH